jgi:hypothetical protein
MTTTATGLHTVAPANRNPRNRWENRSEERCPGGLIARGDELRKRNLTGMLAGFQATA